MHHNFNPYERAALATGIMQILGVEKPRTDRPGYRTGFAMMVAYYNDRIPEVLDVAERLHARLDGRGHVDPDQLAVVLDTDDDMLVQVICLVAGAKPGANGAVSCSPEATKINLDGLLDDAGPTAPNVVPLRK